MKKLSSFIIALLLLPNTALAAVSCNADEFQTIFGCYKTYEDWIKAFWNWSLSAILSIGTIMLVAAGYVYMTSQGIPDRISLAHKLIAGVFSGIGLLIFSYFLIHQVMGIDISLIPGFTNVW